jgi:hypothetical protein
MEGFLPDFGAVPTGERAFENSTHGSPSASESLRLRRDHGLMDHRDIVVDGKGCVKDLGA